MKENCVKFNNGIGIIKKLQNRLPRRALLTIYKSFVRPHINYGDISYDQPNNDSFLSKIRIISIKCSFSHNRCNKGTSQTKIYKELGLESLKFRSGFRRLCTFFKIKQSGLSSYLYNLMQPSKFISAVSNCWGFWRGKQCFYSNHLGKNIFPRWLFLAKYIFGLQFWILFLNKIIIHKQEISLACAREASVCVTRHLIN